jgi:hypothetical protein
MCVVEGVHVRPLEYYTVVRQILHQGPYHTMDISKSCFKDSCLFSDGIVAQGRMRSHSVICAAFEVAGQQIYEFEVQVLQPRTQSTKQ